MMERISVLILASHFFPNYRNPNSAPQMLDYVRQLSRWCDVTVLVPRPWVPPLMTHLSSKWHRYAQIPERETIVGVPVLHPKRIVIPKVNSWTWMTLSVTLSYWLFLSRTGNKIPFDLIEGHFVQPDGIAAAFLARRLGKPGLIHVKGADVHSVPKVSKVIRSLTSYGFQIASAVRTASKAMAELAISLGAPPNKVRVIPNGVDLAKFLIIPREEAKQRLGLDPSHRYLLYVGRLVHQKGVDILLEAMQYVLRKRKDVELLLVGDGMERRALQQQVDRLDLHKHVHFIGAVHHDQIPLWMNAGDILCLLSRREPFGCVLIEALASGTPVVATTVDGVPEIVTEGQVGYLVRPERPEEAAQRILDALETPWDRQALREYAMRFSYEAVIQQLLEFYSMVRNS